MINRQDIYEIAELNVEATRTHATSMRKYVCLIIIAMLECVECQGTSKPDQEKDLELQSTESIYLYHTQ